MFSMAAVWNSHSELCVEYKYLYVESTKKLTKNQNLTEKDTRFVVTRDGGLGAGELDEGVPEAETSSCKVNVY